MKRSPFVTLALLSFLLARAPAAQCPIVPKPKHYTPLGGTLELGSAETAAIVADPAQGTYAPERLQALIRNRFKRTIPINPEGARAQSFVLKLDTTRSLRPDGFRPRTEVVDARGMPLGRFDLAWLNGRDGEMQQGDWHDLGRDLLGMYSSDPDEAFILWLHSGHYPVEITLPGLPWAQSHQILSHSGLDGELPGPDEVLRPGEVLQVPPRTFMLVQCEVPRTAAQLTYAQAEITARIAAEAAEAAAAAAAEAEAAALAEAEAAAAAAFTAAEAEAAAEVVAQQLADAAAPATAGEDPARAPRRRRRPPAAPSS